ncbi:MAG TPA: hypothetical protein PKD86_00485 [Gemmatales bacterium]|nr:hypothetical protein [Gemmatales bacterium]HMP57800.1 hypothetical protein [Gemmatales bacterium]
MDNDLLAPLTLAQSTLEELVVRGIRAAGPEPAAVLQSLSTELEQAGADHLAQGLRAVVEAMATGDRAAAHRLLLAQTSLRLGERLVTLAAAANLLELVGSDHDGDASAELDDEDEQAGEGA